MLHRNTVPLCAASSHIKEEKNALPYVRAHAQYGELPLTSLSSLTTGITFSALAHMEAGEIGWSFFSPFLEPQGNGVLSFQSAAFRLQLPALKC